MADFLNKDQVETLRQNKWNVIPNGCFIKLYRDEFNEDDWAEYCEIIGAEPTQDEITILIFGHA